MMKLSHTILAGLVIFSSIDPVFSQSSQPTSAPTSQPTSRPTTRRAQQPAPDPVWLPVWNDTDGKHINAHGGGILQHEGVYYWFGEARGIRELGDTRRWVPMPGVSCYTSTDLKNWTNKGLVLVSPDNQPEHIEFRLGCTIERPKVVYNAKTKKFVMWFHFEAAGRGYAAAKAALAISDSPLGPYQFINTYRPNAGIWPIDLDEQFRQPTDGPGANDLLRADRRRGMIEGAYARRDFMSGQMSRDMTIYVDDDQKAYLITSAEENFTLHFHELTDDYLGFTGKWMRFMPGGHNEAPAMIKRDGQYYLIASGATGWAPNAARSFTAPNIWGPWKSTGNPCYGINPYNKIGPERTFGGQSTFIMPHPDKKDEYIAMFDIWRPRDLATSAHLWLPLTIEEGKMVVRWREPEFGVK